MEVPPAKAENMGVKLKLSAWWSGAVRSAMSSEPPPPSQPPTHQSSAGLLDTQQARDRSPSPLRGNVVPSPLPTRRTRTYSATVRASQGPVYKGVCKCFCRSKGHGFITPADGGPDIFLHISDVEGEYVPMEGDEVTYKMCSIPPKNEKLQAVEVVITHLAPGTKHETWQGGTPSPVSPASGFSGDDEVSGGSHSSKCSPERQILYRLSHLGECLKNRWTT
ncbi:hypothetical protein R6Z07F_018599 [Ovis aries]